MSLETDVQALTDATTSLLSAVNVRKAELDSAVTNATAQVGLAEDQVTLASNHAGAASASAQAAANSAAQAAIYASQAQATNPDSPIRLNPSTITADFTVAGGYNATSTGPITIADGVTVTVSDNATWSIQ
jgi:peptidoglycan hydrolase CwlO-like protein